MQWVHCKAELLHMCQAFILTTYRRVLTAGSYRSGFHPDLQYLFYLSSLSYLLVLHIGGEWEACMQGQMFGRRADLPQHKASRSLWTLPNTVFVNCSEGGSLEYIQAVVIWAFSFEKCLPCTFSLFLCSSHAISSQERASAPWAVLKNYLAKTSHSWVKKIHIFSIQLSSDVI